MSRWELADRDTPRIKICGLRTEQDVAAAIDAGADAIGLVLASGSPRHVSPGQAARLAALCSDDVTSVMLFVEDDRDAWNLARGHWIQLHGMQDQPSTAAAASIAPVIRAASWRDVDAIRIWDRDPNVSRLLIDSPIGGSGIPFDHDAFSAVASGITTPWILAGGLTPDTVAAAIEQLHPWGVDVSSGVEATRGVKDHGRIAAFCDAVRSASR